MSRRDHEALLDDITALKKKQAVVQKENVYLKTQIQRMGAQLRKKDKQMQHVLSIKVEALTDKAGESIVTGKLNELRKEMMSISRLTAKIHDLEKDLGDKSEELKLLKSSMKFTLIKELQIEAQTYFAEARRLKKQMDRRGRPSTAGRRGHTRQSMFGSRGNLSMDQEEELERLREEVKALRRESVYLRSERELEDKSFGVLNQLRSKMSTLQNELAECQEHISSVDEFRTQQSRLSEMTKAKSARVASRNGHYDDVDASAGVHASHGHRGGDKGGRYGDHDDDPDY